MPVLAEITLGYNPVWVDDDIATWVDEYLEPESGYPVTWVDGAEVSLKIADRRFYDTEYWGELILGFGPVAYAMDAEYGGMITPKAGSITVALTAFIDDVFPPPREGTIAIKHTETTYAEAVTLFSGSCHLASISYPESVVFNLYGMQYGGNILEECEDYEGNSAVYPRGFGKVEHLECVRLEDAEIAEPGVAVAMGSQFTAGYLANDDSIRVYEDGYDITTTIAYKTLDVDGNIKSFVLRVIPQGTVTVSGNAGISTLYDIFEWGCDFVGKSLSYTYDGYSRRIDTTVESQTDILTFLSRVAAGCTHAFYFDDTDLNLFLMSEPVGTARTVNIPAESLITTKIDYLAPKAKATHTKEVITIISDIETSLERSDKDISVITDYSYGDEINIDVNSIDEETIMHRLQAIADLWHRDRMSISLPMAGTLPTPGQQIEIFDDRYDRVMQGTFYVRDISYDFSNRQITISGEGGLA